MRVLVVSSYPPRRCGIGAYARDQAAALREAGDRVVVLSPPDGDGDLRAPFRGGRAFLRAAAVGGAFDRIVVHFQPALYYRPRAAVSKVATSAALLWLVLARRRTEILVHEADPPVRWRPDYLLLGLAFRLAGVVRFHTAAERESLEGAYHVRVRGEIAPHRVRPAAPGGSRREARTALGLPEAGGPLFVCAGFLQPSKGFERAIDAFAEAFPEADRAAPDGPRLVVVGSVRDGTDENLRYAGTLRERAGRVAGVSLVEEFVDDSTFDRWVLAADRVVLPYRRVWSSGLLARAHALGTPAVVSDAGGLGEQAAPEDVVAPSDAGLVAALRSTAPAAGPDSTGRPAAAAGRAP